MTAALRKPRGGMFATKIQGRECSVDIDYTPYAPPTRWEPEEGSFEVTAVYDERGHRSQWLADLMTDSDIERIHDEYVEMKRNWV